ncbi:MAG: hypothetical protein QOH89_2900 [Pseudonocardiales bacterium]|nr:hypothetical protein [Pseudonocardiales bacterium]
MAQVYSGVVWAHRSGSARRLALSPARSVAGSVGVAGFEPTAPRSQSECATKLRHTPAVVAASLAAPNCVPGQERSAEQAGPGTER